MPLEQQGVPVDHDSLTEIVHLLTGKAHSIYPALGDETEETGFLPIFSSLFKSAEDGEPSSVKHAAGTKPHPFDYRVASELVNANPHHSACIRTKKASIVGMGFVPEDDGPPPMPAPAAPSPAAPAPGAPAAAAPPGAAAPSPVPMEDPRTKRKKRSKVSKALDRLCRHSFQDVLSDVCEDYCSVGTGFMEIVRKGSGGRASQSDPIVGIYHVPAPDIRVVLEDTETQEFHYEIRCPDGKEVVMARFGDLDGFLERMREGLDEEDTNVSEVIAFREPSALSEWYGMANWLAAISSIELARALHQFTHDFFQNRAVPEFIMALLGTGVSPADWQKVVTALETDHVGLGKQRRTMALHIKSEEAKLQIEKLAMEGKSDSRDFSMMSDTTALEIVTAHGVPPLLAGIQIPGKLGATNELPNALLAFQLLLVGPAQQIFTATLDCTLGDPELNGGLELEEGDFILRAITDEFNVGAMDTAARMREPMVGSGRDLSEGLKKEAEEALGSGWREVLAEVLRFALDRQAAA